MLTIIAAASENNALGKDNQLVWHLPDDFKRFKAITSSHYIVMGRKTFESFPKPLPNRKHIIITRQKDYEAPEGCLLASSLKKAIELCPKEEEVFIIGGGEIYKQALPFADCIELTRIHAVVDADTYFPTIDENEWQLTHDEFHPADEKHEFAFTFLTYVKKRK